MFMSCMKLSETRVLWNLLTKRHAGHSKWSNIKHDKGVKDSQRSLLFTKLGRSMRVAVQEGGSADPSKNLKLEQVIQQAKRFNMPVATIQSIIKSTQTDKSKCKSYFIEIKGPGSSMILCEVFTEHLHQTRQVIATILKKHSSRFCDGSAKHLFELKGLIDTNLPQVENKNADGVMELAMEHAIITGAEDVFLLDDDCLRFVCASTTFSPVQDKLEELKYNINSASVEFVPVKTTTLSDDDLKTCSSLYEKLENLPDVVRLCDNIA